RSRPAQVRSAIAKRHLRPLPRCSAGPFLAQRNLASAMIDLSDGLSTDLGRLCDQSGVGGIVEAARIPVAKIAGRHQELTDSPLHYALHGGEDYELLFTVPSQLSRRIPKDIDGVSTHRIGWITRSPGVWLMEGHEKVQLHPRGFEHFPR